MNVFKRIQGNAFYGEWAADQPISLSAPAAIDWWHAPDGFSAAVGTGFRKSGGGSLINISLVGSDAGFNDDGGNFVWTDGSAGTGSGKTHWSSVQTIGWGFQIQVPMPRWPDWQILRVWDLSANPHDVTYSASSDDPDAVTQVEAFGPPNPDNDAWDNPASGTWRTEVRFASDRPGRTMTYTLLRNAGSMGNFAISAVALYRGAPTPFPQGSNALALLDGTFGPIGAL